MEKLIITANSDVTDVRMSDYLKRILGFSTALVTKVKFGGVLLNGNVVTMRARVNAGDTVTIFFPHEESENIPPIDIPIDIVYEDEHLIAINKPVDMPVAWTKYWGRGRVFYCSLGHRDNVFEKYPEASLLMERGMLWAADGKA